MKLRWWINHNDDRILQALVRGQWQDVPEIEQWREDMQRRKAKR